MRMKNERQLHSNGAITETGPQTVVWMAMARNPSLQPHRDHKVSLHNPALWRKLSNDELYNLYLVGTATGYGG
jgi:hypothetical protein